MKDAVEKLLDKSVHSIHGAKVLLDQGEAEIAASRAYYAMFYIAEALLYENDLKFKKHSAVHSAFGEQFVKPGLLDPKFHQWLIKSFEKRLISDYDIEASILPAEADATISRAEEFLTEARKHLSSSA
jgi:uncharacterized protein (UPF0332 family)